MPDRVSLEDLMQIALQDKRQELPFFQALLDAEVYAHVPLSDDSGRIRLIQFTRPDGLTVLPFFTSITKSHTAAQMAVKTITLTGRQLMEATRGAILMLNPNNESCTLYPEEIDLLLSTGTLPIVETEKLLADMSVTMRVPKSLPKGLVEALNGAYEKLAFVEAAYVIDLRPADAQDDIKILIIILTPDMHAEHAARATITVVQGLDMDFPYPIDITVYHPDGDKTKSLTAFEPVYMKR